MRIARVLVLVAVVALLLAEHGVGAGATGGTRHGRPDPCPRRGGRLDAGGRRVHRALARALTLATETAEPSPEPSPEADDTAGDAGAHPDNHGAAVSTIARDQEAVGTKTLANGKDRHQPRPGGLRGRQVAGRQARDERRKAGSGRRLRAQAGRETAGGGDAAPGRLASGFFWISRRAPPGSRASARRPSRPSARTRRRTARTARSARARTRRVP